MPTDEIKECQDCGKTYNPISHENCPHCYDWEAEWQAFCDANFDGKNTGII